jgi:hypothetical protein
MIAVATAAGPYVLAGGGLVIVLALVLRMSGSLTP